MRKPILVMAVVGVLGMGCDSGGTPHDGGVFLDLSRIPFGDMAISSASPTEPTCTPPGTVSCPGTSFFASSPTESGCVPSGTTVPNSNTPPYDNPMGTCASVGDITVGCTHSPSCSFCIKIGSAIPPGCAKQ